MKKFLAILTAVALVMSICCFAVSADRIVGHRDGDIDDGVPTFDDGKSVGGKVFLEVGTISNRYAVDVVFSQLTFQANGTIVWDVNNLKYVETGTSALSNPTINVAVTNYSDNPVDVEVTTSTTTEGDTLELAVEMLPVSGGNNAEDFVDSGDKLTVQLDSAAPTSNIYASSGEAKTANLQVILSPEENWGTTFAAAQTAGLTGSIHVATITVAVSKVTP